MRISSRSKGPEQADRPREIHQGQDVKDLESRVERELTDEQAKKQAYQLQAKRKPCLKKQIAHCKLIAPIGGVIVYADEPRPLGGRRPVIEEGATVRERQLIFKVFDLGAPLLVDMKVPEAMVDQVKPGQQARIEVHAFPGGTFAGVVTEVSPLPDPINNFSQKSIKVYTTKIKIEDEQHQTSARA